MLVFSTDGGNIKIMHNGTYKDVGHLPLTYLSFAVAPFNFAIFHTLHGNPRYRKAPRCTCKLFPIFYFIVLDDCVLLLP